MLTESTPIIANWMLVVIDVYQIFLRFLSCFDYFRNF